MNDLRQTHTKLNDILNTLREREAKYAGNAPLDLLDQIADHQKAIALTKQALTDELTEAEWYEAINPLLVAIDSRQGEAAVNNVTQSATGSLIAQATHGGIATVNVENISQKIVNLFNNGSDQQRELRSRQIILQRVHDFWVKGVLENSLHNEVLIELGMEERKGAVEYPWDMVIQRPNQPNRKLPTGTKIVDVFDKSGGSLLILGEPGSGKTTILLDLACDTISRAQKDQEQPIPIVLNLSTWAEQRFPLDQWIVLEFNTKYYIPEKLASFWIENDQLLLLLDGLDEVASNHQNACINAINEFCQQHIMPIVVCCRTTDYESLAHRLRFTDTVLLQSLTPEQIEIYLNEIGGEFVAMHEALHRDNIFRELMSSPLMLSIATLVYRGLETGELEMVDTIEAGYKNLFNRYTRSMFERRGANHRYSLEQTFKSLSWLAQLMKQQKRSIFLIDYIQKNWLRTKKQQLLYSIVIGLTIWLIVGLGVWLIVGLVFGPVVGLIVGLGAGLVAGFISGLNREADVSKGARLLGQDPIEVFMMISDQEMIQQFRRFQLVFVLILGLIIGVSVGLVLRVIFALILGQTFELFLGLIGGLVVGLILGGGAVFRHLILRLLLFGCGYMPWNYTRFLNYACERIFLCKVGGGYIFIHRYLMEYFASLEPETQKSN
jgi:hypothetical protein